MVSPLGRVAWASRANQSAPVVINGSARGSGSIVLDRGAIDPASLRIELSIVSWVRDGVERFRASGRDPRPEAPALEVLSGSARRDGGGGPALRM